MKELLTQIATVSGPAHVMPDAKESTDILNNTRQYANFMQAFTNAMPYLVDPERCLDNIWPELSQPSDGKIMYAAVGDEEHARLEAQYLDLMTIELNLVGIQRRAIGPVQFLHMAQRVHKSLQLSKAGLEQRIKAPTIAFSSDQVENWYAAHSLDEYAVKGNEDVPTSQKKYDGVVTYNLTEQ